jgi:hypothetical protein
MAKQKRCFVISPIGPPGSEVREHADDVFDYIIQPAMEECGITTYRADFQSGQKITEQVLGAILGDDLVIALLAGEDPYVFYQLAVAQCAKKPVIILLKKDQPLLLDIRDLRCVYYDLKPRSLRDKIAANQLVAHVRSIDTNELHRQPTFGLGSPGELPGEGPGGITGAEELPDEPCPVVISYSRKDEREAERLMVDLQTYGIRAWRDRDMIPGGVQWREASVSAIDNCQVILFLVSKNSMESEETARELDIASDARKVILPICLDDTKVKAQFRYLLAGTHRVDFSTGGTAERMIQLLRVLAKHGVGVPHEKWTRS